MRVADRTHLDGDRERVDLVPESLDDLWHLQHVVEPGDMVSGDTTRRIQRADDMTRDTGGEREHLWVAIGAESIEFAKFANRLRVGGEIRECSREDQIGLHHTLNIEERTEISVTKRWQPDQRDRIAEAVAAAEAPDVAIATVEEGEAYVHTVAQYGVEERASLTGATGKGEFARPRDDLFDELGTVLDRMEVDSIILAGPGFTKQDALGHLEEAFPSLPDSIRVVDTASAGDRGVHEVLKRGAVEEVQAETRIAREATLIDALTEQMATGAKAAYGPDNVWQAADYGAVETLLVLDERLRRERAGEGDWPIDANALVTAVERQGGEVVVFSGEFDPGQQLRNLGGVGAILRYRLG